MSCVVSVLLVLSPLLVLVDLELETIHIGQLVGLNSHRFAVDITEQ
jgi:hypothetical protein